MNPMNPMSRPRHSAPGWRAAAGVGLIEILIAIVILAFGMLGIAALQATALRTSQSSINRNEAIAQSYAILDAMRANRSNALIGKYKLASWTCAVPDDDGTLAGKDLNHWVARVRSAQGLGSAANTCVKIEPVAGIQDTYQVSIKWDDSRGNAGRNTQPNVQTVSTASRL